MAIPLTSVSSLAAGTYSPSSGSQLCLMCPANYTNAADGSASCPSSIPPGTDLAQRYAVIVSFGVYFNGTTLDEIARHVGVEASSFQVLAGLVRCVQVWGGDVVVRTWRRGATINYLVGTV